MLTIDMSLMRMLFYKFQIIIAINNIKRNFRISLRKSYRGNGLFDACFYLVSRKDAVGLLYQIYLLHIISAPEVKVHAKTMIAVPFDALSYNIVFPQSPLLCRETIFQRFIISEYCIAYAYIIKIPLGRLAHLLSQIP